jgi:DNA-binding CsgD family transcriptional regulator
MQQEIAWMQAGLAAVGLGVIGLGPVGRAQLMTPLVRSRLAAYFGPPARGGDRLPAALRDWVRHALAERGRMDEAPSPVAPLIVEGKGRRLVVRLLHDGATPPLMLLQEVQAGVDPVPLERFGLTRREAEVLAWVAEGKTNGEIGTILGTRPRTVAKHLERIHQKLGVETRTAAAAVALTSPKEARKDS